MQWSNKFLCNLLLLGILFLSGVSGVAQEICNNSVDDDRDGLIDLHDPDCQCRFIVTDNLLQNGSFELYDHCPVIYTYDSTYNVAAYWQYGTYTNINEADYYHNLNCSYDSGQVMLHMPPKLPLPDGQGFISVLNSTYLHTTPESEMAKGYVGQCLQAPLTPGEQYTLSFYAGRFRSWDNLITGKIFPFTVAVFGNADCNAVPFGKTYALGNGCPTNYPGWVLLGKTIVHSYGEWIQTKVSFTVPSTINVIELGADCDILAPIIDLADSTTFLDYHLYYLDDIHLLPSKDFPFQYIHVQPGSSCNDNKLVLETPVFANATYQWYKDSIAVNGATGTTYRVAETTATNYYNVLISTPGKCIITEPFLVTARGLNRLNIPTDTVLCTSINLILAPAIDGVTYSINGVINTDVTISKAGIYNIVATDNYGCQKTFNVKVVEQKCSDCEPVVPNAFTPNDDGLNDVFKAKFFCNFSNYDFQIFDRWGEKIFETHNSSNGWDGTYLGNKMMPGVYVYFIKYSNGSHLTKTLKGSLILIR
jgi:gliding motility-associated-like protein